LTRSPILVGIDPGWINLGLAVLLPEPGTNKYRKVFSAVYDPSKAPEAFVESLPLVLLSALPGIPTDYGGTSLTVERYVPYVGVTTQVTEDLTMLIGMIRMKFYSLGLQSCPPSPISVRLTRAIDWKTYLAKTLSKNEGFSNPSKSAELDKVFSKAMAELLLINPESIKTSHEADAICLAALPHLAKRYEQAKK
jgi:Holliday junction resolvasome RuvABC endonuclease subunit